MPKKEGTEVRSHYIVELQHVTMTGRDNGTEKLGRSIRGNVRILASKNISERLYGRISI